MSDNNLTRRGCLMAVLGIAAVVAGASTAEAQDHERRHGRPLSDHGGRAMAPMRGHGGAGQHAPMGSGHHAPMGSRHHRPPEHGHHGRRRRHH